MTIKDALQFAQEVLQKASIPSPLRNAEELISFLMGLRRSDLHMHYKKAFSKKEELDEFLYRRMQHEPLEYILGSVSFYSCEITLSHDVLIPRPETEILTEKIIASLKDQDLAAKSLWDICTGSGCLAIALKRAFPDLTVYGSDLSQGAIVQAEKNGKQNQVDVQWKKGDLLQPFSGMKADFVVCNPPYVSMKEYFQLQPEVKDFEPKQALIGGVDGLAYYKRLSRELFKHLHSGARVFLEIGKDQGEAVQRIFGHWPCKDFEIQRDWSGHNRFIFLEIE